jgi:hypothetical protein
MHDSVVLFALLHHLAIHDHRRARCRARGLRAGWARHAVAVVMQRDEERQVARSLGTTQRWVFDRLDELAAELRQQL